MWLKIGHQSSNLYFSGAFAVSFREGSHHQPVKKHCNHCLISTSSGNSQDFFLKLRFISKTDFLSTSHPSGTSRKRAKDGTNPVSYPEPSNRKFSGGVFLAKFEGAAGVQVFH